MTWKNKCKDFTYYFNEFDNTRSSTKIWQTERDSWRRSGCCGVSGCTCDTTTCWAAHFDFRFCLRHHGILYCVSEKISLVKINYIINIKQINHFLSFHYFCSLIIVANSWIMLGVFWLNKISNIFEDFWKFPVFVSTIFDIFRYFPF